MDVDLDDWYVCGCVIFDIWMHCMCVSMCNILCVDVRYGVC